MLSNLSLKEESSKDLGSPGNCQLLQLQLFSPKFSILDLPLVILNVALNRLNP